MLPWRDGCEVFERGTKGLKTDGGGGIDLTGEVGKHGS